jgi:hypothetical protein
VNISPAPAGEDGGDVLGGYAMQVRVKLGG